MVLINDSWVQLTGLGGQQPSASLRPRSRRRRRHLAGQLLGVCRDVYLYPAGRVSVTV